MHVTQLRLLRVPAANTIPNTAPRPRTTPGRPVPELLLELAYHLHASRVVARSADANALPRGAAPRGA